MKFPKSVHAEGWDSHLSGDAPRVKTNSAAFNLKRGFKAGAKPVSLHTPLHGAAPATPVRATAAPFTAPAPAPMAAPAVAAAPAVRPAVAPGLQSAGAGSAPTPPRRSSSVPWVVGTGVGVLLIGGAVLMSRNAPSTSPDTGAPVVVGQVTPSAEDAQLQSAPPSAGPTADASTGAATPDAPAADTGTPASTAEAPVTPPVAAKPAAAEPAPAAKPAPAEARVAQASPATPVGGPPVWTATPAPKAAAPAPVVRTLTPQPEVLAQASPAPLVRETPTLQAAPQQPATVPVTPAPLPAAAASQALPPVTADAASAAAPATAQPVTPPVVAQQAPAPAPATPDPADASITVQVRQALAADATLAAVPIAVSTDHGVVKLEGQAPDVQARERATVVAANTSGVKAVDNRLTLPPVAQLQPTQVVARAPVSP